jgi:carbon monoxide dehydrogenase subunit G
MSIVQHVVQPVPGGGLHGRIWVGQIESQDLLAAVGTKFTKTVAENIQKFFFSTLSEEIKSFQAKTKRDFFEN